MAGDYEFGVEAELDDERYRAELKSLIALTRRQASVMEQLTEITADLDTKKYRSELAAISSERLKDKEIYLSADAKSATATLEALKAEAEGLHADMEVTADISRGLRQIELLEEIADNTRADIEVSADTSRARGQMAMLNGEVASFTRGIEGVASRAGSLALLTGGAGLALGAGGVGLAGFGLATAASLDQAQWAFENLMGSAKAAAPIMKQLKQAALNTPFDLKDTIGLAFRLKSAGRAVSGLAGDAETLADALAATGGGAQQLEGALFQIQQIQGRSKLLPREDLRTLNNQIPGFMGTFNKLFGDKLQFESPKAAMDAIFATLKAIPGAAGAAARATEETFMGRFSKFKDNIQLNFSEAFLPKKEVLFKGLDSVSDAIGGFLKDFAPVGAEALGKLGPIFADLLTAATPVLVLFTEAFPKVLSNFVPVVQKLSDKLVSLGLSSDELADILTKLLIAGAALKAFGMIAGILTPLVGIVKPFVGIISGLVGALAGGAGLIGTFTTAMSTASAAGVGFFGSITAGAGAALTALGPIALVVLGIVAAITAVGVAVGLFVSAIAKSKDMQAQLSEGFKTLVASIKPVLTSLKEVWDELVVAIGPAARIIVAGLVLEMKGLAIVLLQSAKYIHTFAEGLKVVNASMGSILSKVPGLGKFFEPEQVKVAEKIVGKTERIGKSLQEATSEAEKFSSNFRNMLTSELPEIHTIDFGAKDISKEFAQVQKDFDAQLAEIQKRSSNVGKLVNAGYGDVASYALEIGGVAGANLIAGFVEQLEKGDVKAIDTFRETLKKMKIEQKKWELIEASMRDEVSREALKGILSTDPDAVKDLGMVVKEMQSLGGKPGGMFDELAEKYDIKKGTADFKAFMDIVNTALAKQYILDINAPGTAKIMAELPAEVSIGLIPQMDDTLLASVLGMIPDTNVLEMLPLLDEATLNRVLSLIPPSKLMGLIPKLDGVAKDIALSLIPASKTVELVPTISQSTVSNLLSGVIAGANRVLANAGSKGSSTNSKGNMRQSAVGSQFFPGGWSLVGEQGPEMVELPRGSKIYPAVSTQRMLSEGSGGDTYNFEVDARGPSAEDVVATLQAKAKAKSRRFL